MGDQDNKKKGSAENNKKTSKKEDATNETTDSLLGLTATKLGNFGEWYHQLVRRSEMIESYDVSGCFIIRPWAFAIWEFVQNFLDTEFKKNEVVNGYFPMLVKKERLEKEKNHVDGFAPEVAWVTKYGDKNLSEDLALRPTSETIMYPSYANWIRSHRDLPLKINQWNSVLRWEFSQATPFIRSREFLWQEGHTAHATDAEAEDFVFRMLEVYARAYEELLAVPVIKGVKSEGEKFAGAKFTSTIEAFVGANGRSVQAATSHHLGTNFAKIFEIEFETAGKGKEFVHQTSFGFTTRSLGVMLMVHGDDKGAVLPPRVATVQVVIVPIIMKSAETEAIEEYCQNIKKQLTAAGIRVKLDDRTNYKPGWKFNHWELKGVPLRFEVGPRDLKNNCVFACRRDTGNKTTIGVEGIEDSTSQLLEQIQKDMFDNAKQEYDSRINIVTKWEDVIPSLDQKCIIKAPWCEEKETESQMKEETKGNTQQETITEEGTMPLSGGMKPLCCPVNQEALPEGTKCFFTGKEAKRWWLFGRSY